MSASIERTFTVNHNHRLLFTQGLFNPENPMLAEVVDSCGTGEPKRLLFVLDAGVAEAWPNLEAAIGNYCNIQTQLVLSEVLIVSGGEHAKNDEAILQKVLNAIENQRICRHSIVIAIGGGAVIDMVGYAAAIAHRGVGLIRVPTTVLAQNDAAVGVKNGINAFGKKNFIGTFSVPLAIINDEDFLTTLSDRDWVSGTAEAVKVALIKDNRFFEALETEATLLRNREMDPMKRLIFRCAELHIDHIALGGDPFETGSSRPLDFGHWAAHKLEHLSNYALRHGEAVAIGMAIDVQYSARIGWISDAERQRIFNVLETLGFELKFPDYLQNVTESVLGGIEEFREHLGGRLTITLLKGIGYKADVHEIDLQLMREVLLGFEPQPVQ
ncbi:MAG: hypothetical protein RLZZ241_1357 [Bacteroidota bacterium]|jgi:3-dehydroquinate synthase